MSYESGRTKQRIRLVTAFHRTFIIAQLCRPSLYVLLEYDMAQFRANWLLTHDIHRPAWLCPQLESRLASLPHFFSIALPSQINNAVSRYLRMLLIHGTRSALQWAHKRTDSILRWAADLQQRKGTNVAAVALANKLARIVWALLAHGRRYEPMHITSALVH